MKRFNNNCSHISIYNNLSNLSLLLLVLLLSLSLLLQLSWPRQRKLVVELAESSRQAWCSTCLWRRSLVNLFGR